MLLKNKLDARELDDKNGLNDNENSPALEEAFKQLRDAIDNLSRTVDSISSSDNNNASTSK